MQLAISMKLELVLESTFGVVDIYFLGKLLPLAIATVGHTGSLLTLVFLIPTGLSMRTTAMVARRIGECNNDAARLPAWQAMLGVLAIPLATRRHDRPVRLPKSRAT